MSKQYPGGLITKNPVAPTTSSASGVWTLEQQMQAQKSETWPTAFPNYIEDVFSTYLYTGNGTSQTINNGIDLSTKGGLVWVKQRDFANGHILVDTVRGGGNYLQTNTTGANEANETVIPTFTSSGFNTGGAIDSPAKLFTSWTFRKQPKFFDVVTWTGNGAVRNISHSLGSTPGCIFIKRTDTTASWVVYHRSIGSSNYLTLNATSASSAGSYFDSTDPTSTVFTVSGGTLVNASGGTYVAYIFAHDAGGFGLTGTDNVISCGSFNAASVTTTTLGYEPQWLMFKQSDGAGNWRVVDNMRGWPNSGNPQELNPNLSAAETSNGGVNITATGFTNVLGSGTFIYIAIRRGPMKVPTDGTTVFKSTTTAGTGVVVNTTFPVDMNIYGFRSGNINSQAVNDRLRGVTTTATQASSPTVKTAANDAENLGISTVSWNNTGFTTPTSLGVSLVHWSFRRAPSFFDEVCYTGTGSARTVSHNLGVTPTLMIIKGRTNAFQWIVYAPSTAFTYPVIYLNSDGAEFDGSGTGYWNDTLPNSSTFTVGTQARVNGSGVTYVAYLFATCAGVSKVGSYTGNGSSQTVACGFAAGARFVMIKRTDSTGDWYVWDTARGIVSGNDPHLSLNTTAAEVTSNDTIDPDSSGFVVNQVAATNVNVNAATYIYLAIA